MKEFEIDEFVLMHDAGECCGGNTPWNHGYGRKEDGDKEYKKIVKVLSIQTRHPELNTIIYKVETEFGITSCYDKGLRKLEPGELQNIMLEEIVQQLRDEIK